MPAKKAPKKAPKKVPKGTIIPTDEPGQQPTPDADALAEAEIASAGAGVSLADIAASLRAAGVSASREQLDRAFTRDTFDTDIGYHEGLRTCLLVGFQGLTALNNTLDHVKAIKAMNGEETQHARNSENQFYSGINKSDSTFHSGLMKAYGLETDNEVLTTVALTKLVQGLANEIAGIKDVIAAAS